MISIPSHHKCICCFCPYMNCHVTLNRYEGQRDMLYNQTFNLDQVAFASEGIKDAQQTVCLTDLLCYFLALTCLLSLLVFHQLLNLLVLTYSNRTTVFEIEISKCILDPFRVSTMC